MVPDKCHGGRTHNVSVVPEHTFMVPNTTMNHMHRSLLIATLRVARLTLHARKLWLVLPPTVTRVTFDLPECKEPEKDKKKENEKRKLKKKKN